MNHLQGRNVSQLFDLKVKLFNLSYNASIVLGPKYLIFFIIYSISTGHHSNGTYLPGGGECSGMEIHQTETNDHNNSTTNNNQPGTCSTYVLSVLCDLFFCLIISLRAWYFYDRNPVQKQPKSWGKKSTGHPRELNWVCPSGIPSVPPPSYGVYHALASRSVHINTLHR